MAKKNNSVMGGGAIVLMAILVYLFTSKKFLIVLEALVAFVIIYAIIKIVKQKTQNENRDRANNSENKIYAVTADNSENTEVVKYDLSDLPNDTAYFISTALESESQKDFLVARVNYMKAVEELKRTSDPTEYQQYIIPVQKMYDDFVMRDPVYKYLMSKLLPIIQNQNGILQSEISKEFESVDWGTLANGNREVTKDDIYYALWFADRFGHIKRIKKGRSYQLFLPDTEPKSE